MASVAIIGSTGMVGSHILSTLLTHPSISRIDSITRRTPPAASAAPPAKLTTIVDADTSRWASQLSSLTPPPSIFFSAFGTTRAAAGGFENQYKIEHGLNVEMARAARDAGVKVYVLISSSGASKTSSIPYSRMKGLISGQREESRPTEAVFRFIAGVAGKVHSALKDTWAQDSDVIAKAAVNAGLKALEGDVPSGNEKVWVLGGSDIIRLGRTEWKDPA
ncbi:hypothetical protein DTO166G4_3331 [Paecilomyces variotii]|nr:hypothetical protein DTO166G4_3331 [Paecilomyces variotii]KAJ9239085.1 hypothetical protein DTO166G5_2615 [Paecilomyces variotii]